MGVVKSMPERIDTLSPGMAMALGVVFMLGLLGVASQLQLNCWSITVLPGVALLLLLLFAWRGQPVARLLPDVPEAAVRETPAPESTEWSLDLSALPEAVRPDLELIPIPAGAFLMGSPEGTGYDDERPQHRVTLAGFHLGAFAVTKRLYASVTGAKLEEGSGSSDRRPVTEVSWHDAVTFCNALSKQLGLEPCYQEGTVICDSSRNGFRLPSEAEWEYAARAGTDSAWYWGDDEAEIGEYAWYQGNSEGKLHAVGEKLTNPWGLHDMAGNVREWVQDSWHEGYEGAPSDGSAWEVRDDSAPRVLCGGSWINDPGGLRSAYRGGGTPGYRSSNIGFRVLCRPPLYTDH
ncbi:MAG: SUMF1/EgtB/PvdO family nonheme iron enzyme [Sedimenticola sp.]